MLIHLIQTTCQYVVPTKSYKQSKLSMRRKWHTAIYIIKMALNDTLNSVVYN